MLIAHRAHEAVEAFNATPFIAGGAALAVFLILGIVCWSYRDVYNRHADKTGGDSHTAGH